MRKYVESHASCLLYRTPLRYDRELGRIGVRPHVLLMMFILLINLAFAETYHYQGFEENASDTWNYTANPLSTRSIYWGRVNTTLGSANPYQGDWYWASWDLDNLPSSLTFDNVQLPLGYSYQLSFYYFTAGLNPATEYSRYSLSTDGGATWGDWTNLQPNTNAWTLATVDLPAYATQVMLKVEAKHDGISKFAHWDHFTLSREPVEPTPPLVYDVSAAQRTDGSGIVDIAYKLFDANNDNCSISMLLATGLDAPFDYSPNVTNLSGDIGSGIAIGDNKHISWNATAEGINYDGIHYRVRIVAEDNSIPDEFVYVPGSSFTMGNTLGGGYSNELPLHEVTLSSYLIGKYEVTQEKWQQIMGSNPSIGHGVGSDYPVYSVSWYAILKYCNLRSMAEGLTPAYSISGSTNPANWGSVPTSNNSAWNAAICDWSASGYRLPTEAEWEYAARGGTVTPDYIYSGSNNINLVAWWNSNSSSNTHPVGMLAQNGLSTYDMSGNVWEWCWDWYGAYTSQGQINPTGPGSGSYRLLRGSSWYNSATYSRVSSRHNEDPYHIDYYDCGFRLCRNAN